MLEFIKYLFLGILQGFTEPLPVSSSGHVAIFQELLGIDNPGVTFEAFINFGSTLAIILFFYKDIKRLVLGCLKFLGTKGKSGTREFDFALKIVVSTVPLVIGYVLLKLLNIEIGDSILNIGIALMITAVALLYISNKDGAKTIYSMTYVDAFIIGIGQMIALMPGISRSGMTLVFALALGLKARQAFKFSFMMFIPASFGALLVSLADMFTSGIPFNFIVSAIFAFFFTVVGLVVTRKMVVSHKLQYFAYYCAAVSVLVVSWQLLI